MQIGHGARLLRAYLGPQWRRVAALTAALLGGIGLQLLGPQILRFFIDTATGGGDLGALIRIAVLFIVVALLAQAASLLTVYLGEQVAWKATNRLRADLARHCLGLDMPFHNARTPGEMIERIDGDVQALANFFSQFVIQLLGGALLLAGVLALLAREDWRAGLTLTVFALVALLVLGRSRNLAVPHARAAREAHARLFGFLEERLAGIEDLRANGGGAYAVLQFRAALRAVFRRQRAADVMGSGVLVIAQALFAVGYTGALGLGAYLYLHGVITIGSVFLFFQYTQLLRRPLEQVTDQLRDFQRAGASVERIEELRALRPALTDGPGASIPPGALALECQGVSFAYPAGGGADDQGARAGVPAGADGAPLASDPAAGRAPVPTPASALRDVDLALEPGAVLGVLGHTGSGKTTLARLLVRLYDSTTGVIRVGGVDVRDATLANLRARVGIVTQDVQLFQATVRDNLTLFDRSISDERIAGALRGLGLHERFMRLPAGLDTELGPGGAGLSAGEAQLLALARVFLQEPGLVVLDEASSRLDPATERVIERAIDRLFGIGPGAPIPRRTGVIIAHRLRTVERADYIMILERGRVREYGAQALLASDPASYYARLLRADAGVEAWA